MDLSYISNQIKLPIITALDDFVSGGMKLISIGNPDYFPAIENSKRPIGHKAKLLINGGRVVVGNYHDEHDSDIMESLGVFTNDPTFIHNDCLYVPVKTGKSRFIVDNFDPTQKYPINANIFFHNNQLTTKQPSVDYKVVAISSNFHANKKLLEVIWL